MRLILVSSFLVDFVLNWCCNQFVELSTPGKTCHWCIRSLTFSVTCRSKISWGNFQHGLHRLLCLSVVYTGCGCKLRRWAFFFLHGWFWTPFHLRLKQSYLSLKISKNGIKQKKAENLQRTNQTQGLGPSTMLKIPDILQLQIKRIGSAKRLKLSVLFCKPFRWVSLLHSKFSPV